MTTVRLRAGGGNTTWKQRSFQNVTKKWPYLQSCIKINLYVLTVLNECFVYIENMVDRLIYLNDASRGFCMAIK
jgi:hypothetical protein